MKNYIIVLVLVLVVSVGLFWQDVFAIFVGMTPLQAMEQIVTFILHVAVATIAVYAVTTLPELIKPWLKTFKRQQRQARRGRLSVSAKVPKPRLPKPKASQQPVVMVMRNEEKPIDLKWKG